MTDGLQAEKSSLQGITQWPEKFRAQRDSRILAEVQGNDLTNLENQITNQVFLDLLKAIPEMNEVHLEILTSKKSRFTRAINYAESCDINAEGIRKILADTLVKVHQIFPGQDILKVTLKETSSQLVRADQSHYEELLTSKSTPPEDLERDRKLMNRSYFENGDNIRFDVGELFKALDLPYTDKEANQLTRKKICSVRFLTANGTVMEGVDYLGALKRAFGLVKATQIINKIRSLALFALKTKSQIQLANR